MSAVVCGALCGTLLVGGGASAQDAGTPAAESPYGWGPFRAGTQAPLQQFRFVYLHESPALNPPGSLSLHLPLTGNSYWALTFPKQLVDGEFWRFVPALRYTPTRRVDVALEWPLMYLSGGFMDGNIEGWHGMFGLPNDFRGSYPHNRLRFERLRPDGTTEVLLSDRDAGFTARAPVLALRWQASEPGARLPLTLKAAVSFPELEHRRLVVEQQGHDAALGLATAWRFAPRWAGTASLAYVHPRDAPGDQVPYQWSLLLSLDVTVFERLGIVGQMTVESPVNHGSGNGFDDPSFDVLLGGKWQWSPAIRLELGFTENLIHHDNTTDVGLHGSLSIALP
ncbi:MAG: DUF3187 family protein [Candidatus Lambdaproteobacteria bacterium]|nr:DUF3187 family protein [Candidatus Lambdaproteobacteria bacterium]